MWFDILDFVRPVVVFRVKVLVVLFVVVVVVVVKRLGNRVDAIGEIFKLFDFRLKLTLGVTPNMVTHWSL